MSEQASDSLTSGELELARLEYELRAEFPDFKVVPKAGSLLMKVINTFLRAITFNRMTRFLTGYITTIGRTVYVHERWKEYPPLFKAVILRHERVHMRQQKELGSPWYQLAYLFFPLPVVFAWGRMRLEMEAYYETMLAYTDYYGPRIISDAMFRQAMVDHFTGPDYFWMWPFRRSVERWYDGRVRSIRANMTTVSGVSSVQD